MTEERYRLQVPERQHVNHTIYYRVTHGGKWLFGGVTNRTGLALLVEWVMEANGRTA